VYLIFYFSETKSIQALLGYVQRELTGFNHPIDIRHSLLPIDSVLRAVGFLKTKTFCKQLISCVFDTVSRHVTRC